MICGETRIASATNLLGPPNQIIAQLLVGICARKPLEGGVRIELGAGREIVGAAGWRCPTKRRRAILLLFDAARLSDTTQEEEARAELHLVHETPVLGFQREFVQRAGRRRLIRTRRRIDHNVGQTIAVPLDGLPLDLFDGGARPTLADVVSAAKLRLAAVLCGRLRRRYLFWLQRQRNALME